MKAMVVLIALALGGCADSGSLQSLAPVCEALGPLIKYNPHNKNSALHAGPTLATRLATQNRVGVGLHCPTYK